MKDPVLIKLVAIFAVLLYILVCSELLFSSLLEGETLKAALAFTAISFLFLNSEDPV